MSDIRESGFRDRTKIEDAQAQLFDIPPLERTESVSLENADGRILQEELHSQRNVPHYTRAAMDGWAVRAEATFGASSRSPVMLQTSDQLSTHTAVRVHTGSPLPEDANAVVMIEQTERRNDTLEIFSAVGEGENVAPIGEDIESGQLLYSPGHRLRPSDLGLLKAAGYNDLTVLDTPDVVIIPTGEELVPADPQQGEVIETNGLTISRLVTRWGARVQTTSIVPDSKSNIRSTIQTNLDADVIVTTGGSSVGARDLLPEVVNEIGEVLVHGVALKPGHPVALGRVKDTPIVMLPGYPVAAIINAVQFLRPLLSHLESRQLDPFPTEKRILTRKIRSEPGVKTFARVKFEDTTHATPTRASGSGVLSSVALADGWVVVPESKEGIPADEQVTVELWEAVP